MIEREMEDLIAAHAKEFFPRHVLVLKGRQGTFAGVGRFDLLFEDEFQNNILMELKAVPAKLEAAEQLVRYKQALEEKGEGNVIMWLVAPVVPRHLADFLDRFGVEHTEIHEAQFRQVAARHDYHFASEAPASKDQVAASMPSKNIDSTNRESAFHEAMLEIYERAKTECRYNASRFLQMVAERGGLDTARYLLHAPGLSDGFTALWECNRLDLTVEAYILKPEWQGLFTQDEMAIARKRLSDLGYRDTVDAYSDPTPIATAEQFKAALLAINISEKESAMLRAQYGAPNHTISPVQLAKELRYATYATVNAQYGALAHRVAEALHYRPGPFPDGNPHWWRTLSHWNDSAPQTEEGQDQWIMRPELAQALEALNWV
jgi:hypothetical protein